MSPTLTWHREKYKNPSWGRLLLVAGSDFHPTSSDLLQTVGLVALTSVFASVTHVLPDPAFSQWFPQSSLKRCLPGSGPHAAPSKTELLTFRLCAFS